MQKTWSILIFIPVLLIFTSVQAEEFPKRKYCSEGNQLEMNNCDAERFKHADEEMNRIYRDQLSSMQDPQVKDPKSIERFRDAQRAWIAYRDKVCPYEVGPKEESGSAWISSQYACMTYRTELRIKDLKEYLACDHGNCPNRY